MVDDLVIMCADVGSIKSSNFGWARLVPERDQCLAKEVGAGAIRAFAEEAVHWLRSGASLALGFECLLFVSVPDQAGDLLAGRKGEGPRPWSAGAGSAALCCGLVETAWTLREINRRVEDVIATCDWADLRARRARLFLWEAFVTGDAKKSSHAGDAEVAVDAFSSSLPDIAAASAVTADKPFSLVVAAGRYAGMRFLESAPLRSQCVVVRAS